MSLLSVKISTIATGICMFVGRLSQSKNYSKYADLGYAGAALGGLGRHTQITPDGMPIFDGHTKVTFQVVATDTIIPLHI